MIHQLISKNLDQCQDIHDFFSQYLGEINLKILNSIKSKNISIDLWPDESKILLKNICIFFSKKLPCADHHIREDVNSTNKVWQYEHHRLLMYFGIFNSNPGTRGQFIAVSIPPFSNVSNPIEFTLTIAGAFGPGMPSLIKNEDPEGNLHGKSFSSQEQFDKLKPKFDEIFTKQKKIFKDRNKWVGLTPAETVNLEGNNIDPDSLAWELSAIKFLNYFQSDAIQNENRPALREIFNKDQAFRKKAAIRMIAEGLSIDLAFQTALYLH